MPAISSLFIYPIKSCRGIALPQMHFDAAGPRHDRRLMLVDPQGQFISLRRNALMAQIQPALDGTRLTVHAPGVPSLVIPTRASGPLTEVKVWSWTGPAQDLGDEVARWFARVLGEPCRLVRFPTRHKRHVTDEGKVSDRLVAFADAYPLLVTTLESLSELNRRLSTPVSMYRFRPNVVLRECQPFEEDTWETLLGNSLTVRLMKPCARCVAVTVDQHSLRRGKEPLATLATFRRRGHEVLFGQNAVVSGNGYLSVGEALTVASWRARIEMTPASTPYPN